MGEIIEYTLFLILMTVLVGGFSTVVFVIANEIINEYRNK